MAHKFLGNKKAKNMNHAGQSTTWQGWGHSTDKKEIGRAVKEDKVMDKRRSELDKAWEHRKEITKKYKH